MDNDLDLGAKPNAEGKWDIEENEKYKFTPIGNLTNSLQGEFLGQNKVIKGIYIQSDIVGGIFGCASKVRDLTVEDGYVSALIYTGAIAGVVQGDNACLENCKASNMTVDGYFMLRWFMWWNCW